MDAKTFTVGMKQHNRNGMEKREKNSNPQATMTSSLSNKQAVAFAVVIALGLSITSMLRGFTLSTIDMSQLGMASDVPSQHDHPSTTTQRKAMTALTTTSKRAKSNETSQNAKVPERINRLNTPFEINHTYSGQRGAQDAVVDILSIGSRVRRDLTEAQRQSIAKHVSVRHFVVTTEDDDWDQGCHNNNMTYEEDIHHIVHFCKIIRGFPSKNKLRRHLRKVYTSYSYLGKRSNPVGWMCASTRPFVAFYNYLEQYKDDLPDYLVVIDDDSYYEMEGLLRYLDKMDYTPDKPLALAGCRVRSHPQAVQFTFPFGGYGLVQSKGEMRERD